MGEVVAQCLIDFRISELLILFNSQAPIFCKNFISDACSCDRTLLVLANSVFFNSISSSA